MDAPMEPRPEGRFKRLWMEIEVEVVDEMTLRTFDLHATGDGEGNVGLVDRDVNGRVGLALAQVAAEAWRDAESRTGIRWLSSSGPSVRGLDEDGQYAEFTFPRMPQRNDDGSYGDVPG